MFDRATRALRRTDAAAKAFAYAQRALAEIEGMGWSMTDMAAGRSGRLRIATTTTTAQSLRPELLRRFLKENPGVRIAVEDDSPDEFAERLASERVDFGMGTLSVPLPGTLEHPFAHDRLPIPILVVVIFALVADRSNHDFAFADDSKQGYIPRSPKWNDQFALEPVSVGDAASKRIRFQNSELPTDARYCTARQIKVSMLQSRLDKKIFKSQQVLECLTCQGNLISHERTVPSLFSCTSWEIRASRRACIASNASLAE